MCIVRAWREKGLKGLNGTFTLSNNTTVFSRNLTRKIHRRITNVLNRRISSFAVRFCCCCWGHTHRWTSIYSNSLRFDAVRHCNVPFASTNFRLVAAATAMAQSLKVTNECRFGTPKVKRHRPTHGHRQPTQTLTLHNIGKVYFYLFQSRNSHNPSNARRSRLFLCHGICCIPNMSRLVFSCCFCSISFCAVEHFCTALAGAEQKWLETSNEPIRSYEHQIEQFGIFHVHMCVADAAMDCRNRICRLEKESERVKGMGVQQKQQKYKNSIGCRM